jgi:hypothetical protein
MVNTDYFQGIGCLYGNIAQDDKTKKWAIEMQGINFNLFIPPNIYRAWLIQMGKDKDLYLQVYPRSLLLPKKEPEIYFQVFAWSKDLPQKDKPGIFTLKGVWQKIPQMQLPVLTIYRNKQAKDPLEKYRKNHIPCLIKRDDCTPYRYNPKASKEQPDKYFIQGLFKFIPSRKAFGFQKDLEPPTLAIPKYKITVKPEKPRGKINA